MTVKEYLNSFRVFTPYLEFIEFKSGVKRILVLWRSGVDKCPEEYLDKEILAISHTGNSVVFWVEEL